MSLNCKLELFM